MADIVEDGLLDELHALLENGTLPQKVTNRMLLAAIISERTHNKEARDGIMNVFTEELGKVQEQVNHNPLYWVPTQHRGKILAVFVAWIAVVTLSMLDSLWFIAYEFHLIPFPPPW